MRIPQKKKAFSGLWSEKALTFQMLAHQLKIYFKLGSVGNMQNINYYQLRLEFQLDFQVGMSTVEATQRAQLG